MKKANARTRGSGERSGPVTSREGLRRSHEIVEALREEFAHNARVGPERAERVLDDKLDVEA